MTFSFEMQRFRRPLLIAAGAFQIVWALGIVVPAQPAQAAQVIQKLTSSSSASLQTRWYSLRGYGAIPKAQVNWPRRSENCPFNGVTYKTLPWQALDPFIPALLGNYMNLSSNCADRYTDAGTATNGGAWINPDAQGQWAMPGGPQFANWKAGAFPAFSSVMDGCSDGSLAAGNTDAIWGAAGPDLSDQFYTAGPIGTVPGVANGLYRDNYPGGSRDSQNLYSNGVTLVRDSFNLSAADMARLGQIGTSLFFQGYADDWVQVYVNGVAAGAYTTSATAQVSLDLTAIKDLLVPGQNWIGVMAADKAIFDTIDPGSRGAGLCYNLQYKYDDNPTYPGLTGTNGDIHAGGGLCGNAAVGTGNVTTNPQSNSLGSYVISASGAINGIGSNNAAGSTAATLGKTGGYYTVCRQDLVAAAQAYINGGGVYAPLGDVSVNLGTLAPGIYLHNSGGTLTLTGTFSNQITIVSLAGKVAISGNVILNAPSTTASNAPSLGIISRGDIDINAGATRVDGYLFSNSDINTCTQANSACLNTLTVNGFLMGNGINFQRMGPKISNSTATTGEQINLTGQIYLNPPKLFGDLANINLLEAQGEKPPLN